MTKYYVVKVGDNLRVFVKPENKKAVCHYFNATDGHFKAGTLGSAWSLSEIKETGAVEVPKIYREWENN